MQNPLKYLSHHKVLMSGLIAVVVIATAVVSRLNSGNSGAQDQSSNVPRVNLLALKDFQENPRFVNTSGIVESLEQAEIRSQVSAPVSRINVSVGTKVSAGQVLLSTDNRDSAAALSSAQATLKSQQARLDEIKRGLRTEEMAVAEAQVTAAKQALEDTKQQQDVAVRNAQSNLFNSGLQAIPKATNVSTATVTVTGTYIGNNESKYIIRTYNSGGGPRFYASGPEVADGPIISSAPLALGKLGLFVQFSTTSVVSDDEWTILVPNTQSPSYAGLKSALDASIQGRITAVNAAVTALDAAQKTFNLKIAGASSEQIRQAEAAVDQARAAVAAASAQYDKTIIRTPIAGTVSAINFKYGELLTPGAPVATVVNKGGLQIKVYISENDKQFISENADVEITPTVTGKVVRMSPSVNLNTKGVEIQIAVSDPDKSGLVVGQNASIKIKTTTGSSSAGGFRLPIQAVNISQNGASVFSVNGNNKLKEHKVEIGKVTGEKVEIKSGLTADMSIVSTVYELKAGQTVTVQ